MKRYDAKSIRERFSLMSQRTNEALGSFNDRSLGIGRYVEGTSPWQRHANGDELLLVADGEVDVELLGDDGSSSRITITEGGML
jgi:hypothetical protein